ncbi:Alpha/Beta hydrolase protein [Mycena maculata]|uniref:Alpha/Beta hydrolase protein n=1 Tax=Mycena maculata TaxID=230809 RepID=A0AAD7K9S7_9AGAR|nr:Alpha/Beta hydrolase protein [Mycena maculata]
MNFFATLFAILSVAVAVNAAAIEARSKKGRSRWRDHDPRFKFGLNKTINSKSGEFSVVRFENYTIITIQERLPVHGESERCRTFPYEVIWDIIVASIKTIACRGMVEDNCNLNGSTRPLSTTPSGVTVFLRLSVLLVRLPFWVIISTIPSSRPRRSWSLLQAVAVRGLDAFVAVLYTKVGFSPYVRRRGGLRMGARNLPGNGRQNSRLGRGSQPISVVIGRGHRVQTESTGRQARPVKRCSTYFTSGSANPKSDTSQVTAPLLEQTGTLIRRAFAPEYRLCSGAPFQQANAFPASLLDVVAGYQYLVHDLGFAPNDIIVVGLSSGGHLALALVLYLKESNFPSLPVPGGLLLMSPTLDWARTHDTGPSCSIVRNRLADIVGPILDGGYSARALLGALAQTDLATNPYLSPASLSLPLLRGLFAWFPPTCIVAGDAEYRRSTL